MAKLPENEKRTPDPVGTGNQSNFWRAIQAFDQIVTVTARGSEPNQRRLLSNDELKFHQEQIVLEYHKEVKKFEATLSHKFQMADPEEAGANLHQSYHIAMGEIAGYAMALDIINGLDEDLYFEAEPSEYDVEELTIDEAREKLEIEYKEIKIAGAVDEDAEHKYLMESGFLAGQEMAWIGALGENVYGWKKPTAMPHPKILQEDQNITHIDFSKS